MSLRLSIENLDRLPDGGPVRVEVSARGIDIGRDAHLDWVLPDPSRFISGKHCEIRYRDGGYWLHDVSTNGTFVNDSPLRLSEPYRLKTGDRLTIGSYIVKVEIAGESRAAAAAAAPMSRDVGADPWGAVGDIAAPEDRRSFKTGGSGPRSPDFLDFAASVRPEDPMAPAFAPPRAAPDSWMSAPPPAFAPPPEPVAPPTPRRRLPRSPLPSNGAWASESPAPAESSASAWDEPAPRASESAPLIPPQAPVAPPPIMQPPASPAASGADAARLVARLAAAAGIPERAVAGRDQAEVVDEIGSALRLCVDNLAQVLGARAESKSLMRSSSRTMIRAMENNPLKFSATTEEALAIMFGPPSRSYLNARATIAESFSDIKTHQVYTLEATRAAIDELFEDLAPASIDKSIEPDRGLGALVGSRKAKLWDVFVERWRAKTKRSDGRLNEAFAEVFVRVYDRLQNK